MNASVLLWQFLLGLIASFIAGFLVHKLVTRKKPLKPGQQELSASIQGDVIELDFRGNIDSIDTITQALSSSLKLPESGDDSME